MAGPRIPVLVGATASGKTDLAIDAVLESGVAVEILGLDSRQLYRGLDVGTGKPSRRQREQVDHHLIDVLDPRETFDAARYRQEAQRVAEQVLTHAHVPLLVGGAGFYLRALREGFLELDADPERLGRLRAEHATLDDEALRSRLADVDPQSLERLHPNDRYRLERALEIYRLSGRTLSEHERDFVPRPILDAHFDVFHLSPPREELHRRIETRTDCWLDERWREEIESLLAEGLPADCPGLRILGYREVVEWIQGRRTRAECRDAIVIRTRQYARQQEVWFRKEDAVWRGEDPDRCRHALVGALRAAAVPLDSL